MEKKSRIERIHNHVFKEIDGTGLAVFRMLLVVVMWLELNQLSEFSSMMYDPIPFLERSQFRLPIIVNLWKIVLFFMFFGLFTPVVVLINYLFSVAVFSSISTFEYHVYYTYVSAGGLFLLAPVSRRLSLDALIWRLKNSTPENPFPERNGVWAINYFMMVLIIIGVVYLDSVFFKTSSQMWMSGLGMWLPANLPIATWNDHVWLSNFEWLVKSMGYLVIVFEAAFVFVMFSRPFRIPLLIIGVGLHIGILVEFPIPWFAMSAIAIYVLMVPVSWWKFLKPKPSRNPLKVAFSPSLVKSRLASVLVHFFDYFGKVKFESNQKLDEKVWMTITINEKVLQNKLAFSVACKQSILLWPFALLLGGASGKLLTTFLNKYVNFVYQKPSEQSLLLSPSLRIVANKYAWVVLFCVTMGLQSIISLSSPAPEAFLMRTGIVNHERMIKLRAFTDEVEHFAVRYFGLTHHPVFMDIHFHGYDRIVRLAYFDEMTGKEQFLPIIDEKGMPDTYVRGAFWVNYTFRTSAPKFDWKVYQNSISRYARHWLHENKISTDQPRKFRIYVTPFALPTDWEYDFLNKTIQKFKWEYKGDFKIRGRRTELKLRDEVSASAIQSAE